MEYIVSKNSNNLDVIKFLIDHESYIYYDFQTLDICESNRFIIRQLIRSEYTGNFLFFVYHKIHI